MTLRTHKPLTRKTPMPRGETRVRPVSSKRAAYRASDEGQAGLEYMGRVRGLPCCICEEYGFRQTTATQAHHVIHGRYGNRKVPDVMTIPLCIEHHMESTDPAKIALHRQPAEWKRRYGLDTDWIGWTQHKLGMETE